MSSKTNHLAAPFKSIFFGLGKLPISSLLTYIYTSAIGLSVAELRAFEAVESYVHVYNIILQYVEMFNSLHADHLYIDA